MIHLRHMRYFIAVAEELHFGRAAVRLNMAQPPLSQQIRQLEERLGVELFHRTKRRVQLTSAGHVFLTESRQLLAQLERAVQKAQQAGRGEHGALAIGFVSSASYSILPTILQRFRRQYPAVQVILRELSAAQQADLLESGHIDIGIARSPIESPQLQLAITLEEPLIVALPENHSLSLARTVSIRSLALEPFILFPRPLAPALYDQIISLCRKARFSPNVVQEAIQMQTILGLVAAEIGIAIVPHSLQNLQRTGVVYRTFKEPLPKSTVVLVHRRGDASPVVQRFLDVVQSSLSLRPEVSRKPIRTRATD